MRGRSTREPGRSASSTELILDLTTTAALGVAAAQLAEGTADGRLAPSVLAFCAAVLSIVLAWTNHTWFASAFENNDWLYRLLAFVQVGGVIVMAIGLSSMFRAVVDGRSFAVGPLVGGYVIMRVALVACWLRAAVESRFTRVAVLHAGLIVLAQVGWVALWAAHTTLTAAIVCSAALWLFEFASPFLANHLGYRWGSAAPPWHAGHIADRYATLTLITLGETVVGTLAGATIVSANDGWSFEAAATVGLGISLTFTLWSAYQGLRSAEALDQHRLWSGPWSWLHLPIFLSIAAVGAGLHLLGFLYDPEARVDVPTAVTALAVPVLIFDLTCFILSRLVDVQRRWSWIAMGWAIGSPTLGMTVAFFTTPDGSVDSATGGAVALWLGQLLVLAGPLGLVLGRRRWQPARTPATDDPARR